MSADPFTSEDAAGPCPHGRLSWGVCPWCLGLNGPAIVDASHRHQWTRTGVSSGTSVEPSWGPWRCWCGGMYDGPGEPRPGSDRADCGHLVAADRAMLTLLSGQRMCQRCVAAIGRWHRATFEAHEALAELLEIIDLTTGSSTSPRRAS